MSFSDNDEDIKEGKGCAILIGFAFICVAIGSYFGWWFGVLVFGVFLLVVGFLG
jgi:hypothetical protein